MLMTQFCGGVECFDPTGPAAPTSGIDGAVTGQHLPGSRGGAAGTDNAAPLVEELRCTVQVERGRKFTYTKRKSTKATLQT